MYLLTSVSNGDHHPILVSQRKKKLVEHLKECGFYWSKKHNQYIGDKNGNSSRVYIITNIEKI